MVKAINRSIWSVHLGKLIQSLQAFSEKNANILYNPENNMSDHTCFNASYETL